MTFDESKKTFLSLKENADKCGDDDRKKLDSYCCLMSDIIDEIEETTLDKKNKKIVDKMNNDLEKLDERISKLLKEQKQQQEQHCKSLWLTTDAPASKHGFSGDCYWYKEGVFSYIGYTVGSSGKGQVNRQKILDWVFCNNLPKVNSKEYMDEWADKETPQRLRKMAESIAAFARNAKRRSENLDKAIKEWEDDLDYLHHKYYDGSFDWPSSF